MGLDALVAALEAGAARDAEAIRHRAEQQAEALRLAAEVRAAEARGQRARAVEASHVAAATERITAATRTARLQVLEAERAWLERVRADAEAALVALPLERWSPAIPALVGTALLYAGTAAVTLHCAPAAEDAVWAVAGARLDTTVRGVEGMEPGLVLVSDDARLTVPLTVRSRLVVRWPDLQLLALTALEAGP